MKFCMNCKHFKEINFCMHPNNGTSPVYGSIQAKFASSVRSSKPPWGCGEDADWFEEKPLEPHASAKCGGLLQWLREFKLKMMGKK